MRIATIQIDQIETAALQLGGDFVPMAAVNRTLGTDWPSDTLALIAGGHLAALRESQPDWSPETGQALRKAAVAAAEVRFAPLYRHPPKIWGIGLNYAAHAADLAETAPTGIPGSFMKPDTTVIGWGDVIHIPARSRRTTAEAELGVVIGTACRNVAMEDWLDVVAGFTPVIDMTAEDILKLNPRYLTVAKSFDTFFSFGPVLLTPDEIPDVAQLQVTTIHNGRAHAENVVANMTFSPAFLVSFLSEVMTLRPGDVISTGTPGAAVIADGDAVACRITGFPPLQNPVVDRKARSADSNRKET